MRCDGGDHTQRINDNQKLSGWPQSPQLLIVIYALGVVTAIAAAVLGTGSFIPWTGMSMLFRTEGAGLAAAFVTIALAILGNGLIAHAWLYAEGIHRHQMALVLASSGLGLASVSGLAFPIFDIHMFPWPLLLLPAYLAVLVYAVLRYQLMDVNRWARLAVSWALLVAIAGATSALSAGMLAKQVGAPLLWTAAAAFAGFVLAAPARRLADRIIYPGGEITAADLANWRRGMAEADDEAGLQAVADNLLRERLKLPTEAPVGNLNQAPPGARRVAEVIGELLTDARRDLNRRRAFAERERLAELGALAATIAHDLRNPMNIVSMAVAAAEPAIRAEVKTQLKRMDALVKDLMDYAKPWRVVPATIDLAATVTGTDFSVETDFPRGLTVRADPFRLRQALVNLVENAKAAGGRVQITAERLPEAVLVHVCDDGTGIPEDIRSKLFQPFVSRGEGGTGLGLAIVAKVMVAHSGTATLTTRPGWTTCFTLRFPQ